jgi:hypothetical protein
VEGDVHLEWRKGFWERIRQEPGAEKWAFGTEWQPSNGLRAAIRGRLVVDPARTWSSRHFRSESEAVPRNKSLAGVRDEFSLFNIGAMHRSDIFDVDILLNVSMTGGLGRGRFSTVVLL